MPFYSSFYIFKSLHILDVSFIFIESVSKFSSSQSFIEDQARIIQLYNSFRAVSPLSKSMTHLTALENVQVSIEFLDLSVSSSIFKLSFVLT